MASCGSEGVIVVGIEADGPGHGSGVEVQEAAEFVGTGEDEVGGQEGGGEVVLGVEGDVVDRGVLGAEDLTGSDQGGVEDGEGRSFREVMQHALVGEGGGVHGGHRFFPAAAAFLGGG